MDKKSISVTKRDLKNAQEAFNLAAEKLRKNNKEKLMHDTNKEKWKGYKKKLKMDYDYLVDLQGNLIFNEASRTKLINELQDKAKNLKIANKNYQEAKYNSENKEPHTNDIKLINIKKPTLKILAKDKEIKKFNNEIDKKISRAENDHKGLKDRLIRYLTGGAKGDKEKKAREDVKEIKKLIVKKRNAIKSTKKEKNVLENLQKKSDTLKNDLALFSDNEYKGDIYSNEINLNNKQDELSSLKLNLKNARQERSKYVETIDDVVKRTGNVIERKVESFVQRLKNSRNNTERSK